MQGADDDVQASNRWTLTHGFYAAMGGFVLDIPPNTPGLERGAQFVLTPAGVRWLMMEKRHIFPHLSEDSLLDRSKAGAFQKSLPLWQMFYFCASCIQRRYQALPLSLLEVSTLAHASCMFIICLLWWRKPVDIEEPTLIRGPDAMSAAASLLSEGLLSPTAADSPSMIHRNSPEVSGSPRADGDVSTLPVSVLYNVKRSTTLTVLNTLAP